MAHLIDNIGADNVKFTTRELQDFTKELNIIQILQINVKEKLSSASKTYRSILFLKEDLHNELIQIYTELLEKNSQKLIPFHFKEKN